MDKRLKTLLACSFLSVGMAMAQTKVTGTVVSDEDGQPLVGVAVKVAGTGTGTVTDANGHFAIDVKKAGAELEFTYVGMQSYRAKVSPNMHIVLLTDNQSLNEVVVTALGITKSQKSIGYAATTMREADLKAVPVTNVTEAIAGKVAGVNVSSAQAGPGGGTSVTIRSFSSITGNNEPLWVIDGVPVVNNSVASGLADNTMGAGVSNINQDDIESMTVLKGAAATALYGSRAANGVILVTTKNGSRTGAGKSFKIEANLGVQWSRVANLPQMQDKYGQGWNGIRSLDENGSWGPEMDGAWRVYGAIYDNAQLLQQFQAVKDNVKNFFETGVQQNYSVNMAGNTGKTNYYVSYSHINEDGIIPGDYDTYQRNTVSMRGRHSATDWLRFSSNMNLAVAKTQQVPTDQGTTMIDGLYEMPRNISIADLKDLTNPFNTPEAYYTEYGVTNPYWALANNHSTLSQKKFFGKVQMDVTPVKDVTLTYRVGLDYSDFDLKEGLAKITADNPSTAGANKQEGTVFARYQRRYELNHDILANYCHEFGKFSLDVTLGVNFNERYLTQMSTQGANLTIPTGWWTWPTHRRTPRWKYSRNAA